MVLKKTSLQRRILLEEGAVAILPLSRQPSERASWNMTFLFQCPSVSVSISHMCLKGTNPQPENPSISREWSKAGWSACRIPGWLIEMQCFQQLPAASVFPGFHFHTLLSFCFVVFSPHFVSCFHLPWLLAALCYCCVEPPGFGKAGLHVDAGACLRPSPLGHSTCPIHRAMLMGHSMLRSGHGSGWMRANSLLTGHGALAVLLLTSHTLVQEAGIFQPALQVGFQTLPGMKRKKWKYLWLVAASL